MPYITAFFKMYINQCTAHVQKRGETNQLVGLKGLGITVVQGDVAETHQTQIREVRELLVCNPLGETTDATIIQRQADLVVTKRTILLEMQQYVKKCAYFMLKEVLHKDILQEVKTYGSVHRDMTWEQMLTIITKGISYAEGQSLYIRLVCMRRKEGEDLVNWVRRLCSIQVDMANAKPTEQVSNVTWFTHCVQQMTPEEKTTTDIKEPVTESNAQTLKLFESALMVNLMATKLNNLKRFRANMVSKSIKHLPFTAEQSKRHFGNSKDKKKAGKGNEGKSTHTQPAMSHKCCPQYKGHFKHCDKCGRHHKAGQCKKKGGSSDTDTIPRSQNVTANIKGLTAEKRAKRKKWFEEGKCLNCGSKAHRRAECTQQMPAWVQYPYWNQRMKYPLVVIKGLLYL